MYNILYLEFYPQVGGAEVCLLALLRQLDRTQFHPTVVCQAEGPLAAAVRDIGVDVEIIKSMAHVVTKADGVATVLDNFRSYCATIRRLLDIVHRRQIHLVHAHITPTFKYAGLLGRLANVPVVGTLHDALIDETNISWTRRKALLTNVRYFFDKVVTPSDAIRNIAVTQGGTPSKFVTIHNGVDPAAFDIAPHVVNRIRHELASRPETFLVGMIGRMVWLKGHDVLIHAMAEITDVLPHTLCVIVGDAVFEGEEGWKAQMIDLVSDLGLTDRVDFLGWRHDVPAVMQALDVVVVPSTAPDAFPTVVLEAMAAGKPVVTANVGGAPEAVQDWQTGLLVEPNNPTALANALFTLASDKEMRTRMGQAGRKRVETRFGAHLYARRIESLYLDILLRRDSR